MFRKRVLNIARNLEIGQAAFITSGANRLYLTGFSSSAGCVLITKQAAYFLIDFRYFEKAKNTVNSCKTILLENFSCDLSELFKKHNISRLYVETRNISYRDFNRYSKMFENVEVSFEDKLDNLLERLRSRKTIEELENIKIAQKLTDETFSYIIDRITVGKTEREIMLDMEFFMRKRGSEGVSFDFIVISGKNSSLPHGVPTDKKIEKGDFITMDFGAVVNGYRSDMTRTVAVGNVNEKQINVYDTVLLAQKAALKEIRSGKVCKNIDAIARNIINDAGYEGCFGHGLGHSVGIEIHENPTFNTRCETVLESGMVMTVEPGIYIENEFGVRIEDMVYVTDCGCINLTKSSKELIVL
ncbi:MAG: aminopeptidase P family protein [Clostridia bacterium]|nr:aminopeptidase P family protein [Clostridia bacterium]